MIHQTPNVGYAVLQVDTDKVTSAWATELFSPLLDQFNQYFNYPNSVEVIDETRPLKVSNITQTSDERTGHSASVMQVIIAAEPLTMMIHYADILGHRRIKQIDCDKGTAVILPSVLTVSIVKGTRWYIDWVFDIQAQSADGRYVLSHS